LATANLVTRTEPVRVDCCAWEPFIQQRETQHMGRSLQQHPITPTHSPTPLCFATHAFTCSHTLRTQCYAYVWAQAINPGCALASSNVPGGKIGQDKTHHPGCIPSLPSHSPPTFEPYSPAIKRPWPGGKTNIFRPPTRPHQTASTPPPDPPKMTLSSHMLSDS